PPDALVQRPDRRPARRGAVRARRGRGRLLVAAAGPRRPACALRGEARLRLLALAALEPRTRAGGVPVRATARPREGRPAAAQEHRSAGAPAVSLLLRAARARRPPGAERRHRIRPRLGRSAGAKPGKR